MIKQNETPKQRSDRILQELEKKYSNKKAYDLDGQGLHFFCEIESIEEHPEYDRTIEVIISSKPHKHNKMTQHYTILKGNLKLHVGDEIIKLKEGDKYTVEPKTVHSAESTDECWVEIYSKPGWTKEDHILVNEVFIK